MSGALGLYAVIMVGVPFAFSFVATPLTLNGMGGPLAKAGTWYAAAAFTGQTVYVLATAPVPHDHALTSGLIIFGGIGAFNLWAALRSLGAP